MFHTFRCERLENNLVFFGKLIKYKSKKTPKYCSKCAKEIQQEQKNKWKREKWHKEEI